MVYHINTQRYKNNHLYADRSGEISKLLNNTSHFSITAGISRNSASGDLSAKRRAKPSHEPVGSFQNVQAHEKRTAYAVLFFVVTCTGIEPKNSFKIIVKTGNFRRFFDKN
jgi:hypothetical protein